jgi:hypothetical protein
MKSMAAKTSRNKRTKERGNSSAAENKTAHRKSAGEAPHSTLRALPRQVPLPLEHFPAPYVKRITLEACFPTTKEVLLAGSFNDWQPAANPLQNQGGGRWIAELDLERGRYEYRFVVDGGWADDPMACFYATNIFGTVNGVLLVS